MTETFYFNPIYGYTDKKFDKSSLTFESVYGEPGCYVAAYLLVAIVCTSMLLLIIPAVISRFILLDRVEFSQTSAQVLSCLTIPDDQMGTVEFTYQYTVINWQWQSCDIYRKGSSCRNKGIL